MNVSGIWKDISSLWKPVREKRTTETDKTIQDYAPDRIKRSPGHQNLADLTEEPDWYHDG